jgi:hypothetical protein
MFLQAGIRHIFTPANERVRCWDAPEFSAKAKGTIQQSRQIPGSFPGSEESPRLFWTACGRKASNFTLDKRRFQASDPGRFTRAVNPVHSGLLQLVDLHIPAANLATE